MNRLPRRRGWPRRLAAAVVVAGLAAGLHVWAASAQTPGEVKINGTLAAIHIDNPDDRISAGRVVVGRQRVEIPSTVNVQMPGDQLTLQELFARAPARCRALHESGLVPSDQCRRPPRDETGRAPVWTLETDTTPRSYLDPEPTDEAPPTIARVLATHAADGGLVATNVALTRTDRSVSGAVTFVNEEQGYVRVNGAFGSDAGGALLRINDPESRQSVQTGTGCGAEGNCSPDVRFKVNSREPSVRFEAGYAACVPGGLGAACSQGSRPVRTPLDGNAMVAIVRGDHVTARGGFEVHDGVRVFWAHSLVVHTSPVADAR